MKVFSIRSTKSLLVVFQYLYSYWNKIMKWIQIDSNFSMTEIFRIIHYERIMEPKIITLISKLQIYTLEI